MVEHFTSTNKVMNWNQFYSERKVTDCILNQFWTLLEAVWFRDGLFLPRSQNGNFSEVVVCRHTLHSDYTTRCASCAYLGMSAPRTPTHANESILPFPPTYHRILGKAVSQHVVFRKLVELNGCFPLPIRKTGIDLFIRENPYGQARRSWYWLVCSSRRGSRGTSHHNKQPWTPAGTY